MLKLQNNNIRNSQTLCERCTGRLIEDIEQCELVCSKCGFVQIQNESNHNFFPHQIESSRKIESNLSSLIDVKNIDVFGNKIITYDNGNKLRKLNKIATSDSKIRNISKAYREIEKISKSLGLGKTVVDRSEYLYKKAMNKGFIKGRPITGIAGAIIYITCNEYQIPCSIYDVVKHLPNVKKKTIVKYYKEISHELNITSNSVGIMKIISKIAKKANVSVRVERKAIQIFETINGDPILAGKRPNSIVAALLYFASIYCNEKTTQLRLANAADLTPMTIRKRVLEISEIYKKKEAI